MNHSDLLCRYLTHEHEGMQCSVTECAGIHKNLPKVTRRSFSPTWMSGPHDYKLSRSRSSFIEQWSLQWFLVWTPSTFTQWCKFGVYTYVYILWFSRYNLMPCWPRKLLEASTLKYSEIHCPFWRGWDLVDIQWHLSAVEAVTTTKMGHAAAGSWSFPMLWELTESCLREATRNGIR